MKLLFTIYHHIIFVFCVYRHEKWEIQRLKIDIFKIESVIFFIIFWYFNPKMYQIFQIQSLLWTLKVPAWNNKFWKKLWKVLSFHKIWVTFYFLSFPFLEHLSISLPWLKIYWKFFKSVLNLSFYLTIRQHISLSFVHWWK